MRNSRKFTRQAWIDCIRNQETTSFKAKNGSYLPTHAKQDSHQSEIFIKKGKNMSSATVMQCDRPKPDLNKARIFVLEKKDKPESKSPNTKEVKEWCEFIKPQSTKDCYIGSEYFCG
jgi:hypothetical protein